MRDQRHWDHFSQHQVHVLCNQSVRETVQVNLHQSPASSDASDDAMMQKATSLPCEQISTLYIYYIYAIIHF